MSRAAYIPDFPVVILRQRVSLIGFGEGHGGGDLIVNRDVIYGRFGVASLSAHSSGRRHVRMFCTVPDEFYFPNGFRFGLCGRGVVINSDEANLTSGNSVYFACRINGASGVIDQPAGDAYGSFITNSERMRRSFVFDIKCDFSSNTAVFTLLNSSGDIVMTHSAALVADEQYRVFVFCGASMPAMKIDLTGETFEPEAGYKVWDAN